MTFFTSASQMIYTGFALLVLGFLIGLVAIILAVVKR